MINHDTIETIKEFTSKSAIQKEFLFYMAKAKNEDEISRLREMFDQLDTNNSGMLTISEIRKAFHKLGYVLPEKEFKKIWKGLDFHDEGTINYT